MGLLTGKVALITGAARGIGKAIALKFADEGADIAFTDLVIDEEHGGLETEREIAAKGVKAKGYSGNAADFAETEALVNQINKDFGHIDILVNNAGITKDGLMLKMTEQQWDAVINVNLKSAFNFIHACTPVMMHQKGGSIRRPHLLRASLHAAFDLIPGTGKLFRCLGDQLYLSHRGDTGKGLTTEPQGRYRK